MLNFETPSESIQKAYRHANIATLERMPNPTALGPRHRPVRHDVIVNAMIDAAKKHGHEGKLKLRLKDGSFKKATIPGARLYASMVIENLDCPVPGTKLAISMRHAHDQSSSIQLTQGLVVMVCRNGMQVMEASNTVRRKHTSGLGDDDIPGLFDRLFAEQSINDTLTKSSIFVQGMQQEELTDETAARRFIQCAEAGAIAANRILPVWQEWQKPSHPDFADRNAWSAYNAVTETLKAYSPDRQADGLDALNDVFLPGWRDSEAHAFGARHI